MKTLLFDWSGTLNNNFHCFCEICDMIFEYFNKEKISPEEIKKHFSTPYMSFWNRYIPELTIEKQKELYEKFADNTSGDTIYPTVKDTIEYFYKKGYTLYIVSSDPISKLIPSVEQAGIKDYFEQILGDVHNKKEGLAGLLKEANINPQESYYIGDTSGDVEAGKYANMKTVGISRGFQDKELLAKSNPDILIDDIIELKNL